jgi:hypothetical protein
MPQPRDFGPQAADMRAALERYSKEELVELTLFIMKTYVLGSATTPDIEVGPIHPPAALDRMSFPQLVNHLQMSLKLEELEHFRVVGPDVYVTIGEREFDLLGSTPQGEGAPAPAPAAVPAPVARPARPLPQPRSHEAASHGGDASPFAELAAQARAEQPPRPVTARPAAARPAAARPAAARPAAARPAAASPASSSGLDLDLPGASSFNDADFEMDDAISQRISERNPSPEPLVKGQRDAAPEFGGSRPRPSPVPQPSNTRLQMTPPPPPPPIAQQAPGDLSPEERARSRHGAPTAPAARPSPAARAGAAPALKGEDKEVTPNNRFGDLELD